MQAKLTSEQIKTFRRINMSIDQFMKHCERFSAVPTRESVARLDNGAFLAVWKKENGVMVRIHLKKIFFKPYSLKYRTTKTKSGKYREGEEILISSFPFPRGSVV